MSMKNPLTPAGIEPENFRFVTQQLNHCATAVPKHVEFYPKNKFEILVNFVGFVMRIYHDARASECQTHCEFECF